ncbi:AraC family transcriptional regulator [Eubacteriales bacterium OttesenSCG-928-A19]|nr:AraC family transcriptional regulator [Eubacteriales bacterium OttesenSCG-928-A19]
MIDVNLEGVELFTYRNNDRAIAPLPSCVHENCIEILVLHKGIQTITVEGDEFVVAGGDIVIIPAGYEHSTGQHPQYSASYYRILLHRSEAAPLLGLDSVYSRHLRAYLSSLQNYRYRSVVALTELVASAYRHAILAAFPAQMQARGELICFLTALENALCTQPTAKSPAIEAVFRYINDHITEELSLQELADLSGCSLSYFKESFLKQVGATPMYYINWRRIAHAKRMIAQGYSATETSMLLNFSSPTHFSTVFKNYTARTPMQYKALVDMELQKQRHLIDWVARI